ncbi:MAG: multicopper oxidase domain-containing protein [Gemmatimonadaceae bacterium]
MRSPLVLAVTVLAVSGGHKIPAPEAALPNDNRLAAGRLTHGVLALRLEARQVVWHPEADDGAAIPVYAFAEAGQRARIPGPLIRVPVGTEIRATVRNMLPKRMHVYGLHARGSARSDSSIVPPGATEELRFRADLPGTYYYWGRTEPLPPQPGPGVSRDAALLGAFIVDSAHAAISPHERILVINGFFDTVPALGVWSEEAHQVLRREFLRRDRWVVTGVNGKSWPHTERLSYTAGDTVRFRIISAGPFPHPMHLHGFYFHVDARGDAQRDTMYAAAMRRQVVTEWMTRGTTMSMRWVADRPGNWLFHCHLITHMSHALRLPGPVRPAAGGHGNHAESGMAGLVMGIRVAPARSGTPAVEPGPRRRLRLFVTEKANVYGERPGYSYVLQQGVIPPAADSIRMPSSSLLLHQDEPTEIAVINVAKVATTVHWHGLELQSYYDGVGNWSGWGQRVAPSIAPGDSFVVRLTPPRAGTFIYHTHMDEGIQLASGLFGALIVLPPGATADTTERLFLIGIAGPHDDAPPTINGSPAPPPVELRAGVAHRFRFINISPMETRTVELLAADTLLRWRAVAKDGADLPPAQAAMRPASVALHAGETYDFKVERQRPESLTLRITGNSSIATRAAFVARASPGERSPRLVLNIPVIVR